MKGIELLFLVIGAVAGAFVRYKIVSSQSLVFGTLSINVLIVNIAGSFILGIFSILSIVWNLDAKYSFLVAVGFCGYLTTMSSFALETNNLIDNKQFQIVALNILLSVGLSIGAVFRGSRILTTLLMTGGGV